MWRDITKLGLVTLLTAGFQCLWHWLLSKNYRVAEVFVDYYLSYDPKVNKGHAGYFDLIFPSVWLGLWIGYVGWKWPISRLLLLVFVNSVILAFLLPVYFKILGVSTVWWWPANGLSGAFGRLALSTMQSFLVVGFFAYLAANLAKYRHG